MSAEQLKKTLLGTYEGARRELARFDRAVENGNTAEAAKALHSAASAICAGLAAAEGDLDFWAEMANRLIPTKETQASLNEALANLDKIVEEEERVFKNGGFSVSAISQLLGEFVVTLRAFKELPTGATLVLAQRRVSDVRRHICELSSRPIKIEQSFWGHTFRIVKVGFKALAGVSTIAFDLATTPISAPVVVVSLLGGIDLLLSVGEEIGRG